MASQRNTVLIWTNRAVALILLEHSPITSEISTVSRLAQHYAKSNSYFNSFFITNEAILSEIG